MSFNSGNSTLSNNKSFVQSETQRIYAEYKNLGEESNDNHSKRATVEAFDKASKSLIGDFVNATRGI